MWYRLVFFKWGCYGFGSWYVCGFSWDSGRRYGECKVKCKVYDYFFMIFESVFNGLCRFESFRFFGWYVIGIFLWKYFFLLCDVYENVV